MVAYLSRILDQPVWNNQGQRIGRCRDVLVLERDEGAPIVRAIAIVREDKSEGYVPASQISTLTPAIILKEAEPKSYEPRGNELRLREQMLDRQIVDVEGRQVVRVNDIEFAYDSKKDTYYLTGVAVGPTSLLRRLGIEEAGRRFAGLLGKPLAERVIPWWQVAPVQPDAPIRLRVTRDKIEQINPVDIADIVSELDHSSGVALINMLDDEVAADTISEVAPELQATLLAGLPPERAADVLEEMDPDDAADLLATLPETTREDYLELIEDEDSVELAKLLTYPEDTAGGIMTTEFATCPLGLRAGEAIEYLRRSERAQEDEALYYVHIVDEEGKLRGVVTLRDLVMADPSTPVEQIMVTNPITVDPLTPQREVARVVAKYDLLEVPVVDQEGVLQGIVTVDDAIDAVIPTAWKKRLPHFY
ncbi:MAG: magnesium transporter [Chloroflexi bacterium]|nr:magnesium transporter [Chloroflexota bacterium]